MKENHGVKKCTSCRQTGLGCVITIVILIGVLILVFSGIWYAENWRLRIFSERLADIPVPEYSEAIARNSGIWKSGNTGSSHLFSATLYRSPREKFDRNAINKLFGKIEILAPECDGDEALSPSVFFYEESEFDVFHETGLSPMQRENYKVFGHIPKNEKHYVYYIAYMHCSDTLFGFK